MRLSIQHRILVIVVTTTAMGMTPLLYLSAFSVTEKLLALGFGVALAWFITRFTIKNVALGLTSLDVGLQNFKDGEFSSTLAYRGEDELEHLCALYNETADKLRQEKQWLMQRELMLDKVLHSSPDVLLLVNDQQQVVFSNYQARDFFAQSQKLEGYSLGDLLAELPATFQDVMQNTREGLFTLPQASGEIQTWHLATGSFLLNNQHHSLYIIKQMTRELNRQEVSVWKKVIRVISHELNNSLGPISSLLHSGQIVSKQNGDERLERVFSTIEERIAHLIQFVQGYGKFAKLPTPVLDTIDWTSLLEQLNQQCAFKLDMHADVSLQADAVQLEQLLINLLKNAHESGSEPEGIELFVQQQGANVVIEVRDRGKGMSDTVLANALIPFYSTKSSGSGLGLALCREIADAHHGHLIIQNREDQGLCVRVVLPSLASVA